MAGRPLVSMRLSSSERQTGMAHWWRHLQLQQGMPGWVKHNGGGVGCGRREQCEG